MITVGSPFFVFREIDMNLMPFDELNTFRQMVTEYKTEPLTNSEKERLRDDIEEYIEYLLFEAYTYGNVQAMDDLGLLDRDPADLIDRNVMEQTINEPIADKTYKQRIREYLDDESSTVEDFQRVAETDATRVYNAGVVDGGKASGVPGVMKQWITMEDERVRSTHEYLQSMTVPLGRDFYTYDGDHARAPGLFTLPENNINCRCTLQLIRE
jgi:hypothetical protein